jgi:type I restriction enzyme S subunit
MATGHTPSRKHPEYWGGEIPWISVGDARDHDGGVIYEGKEYTNPLGIAKSAAVILPKETVCLSRTASIGYAVRLGKEMATSQGFANWICGPALVPQFLQYLFLAERPFLYRVSEGAAHTTIYFPELKAFHVLTPPPGEQRRIVDAIESNFARLDETVEGLRLARVKIKRYREVVLTAGARGLLAPEVQGTTSRSSDDKVWTNRHLREIVRLQNGAAFKPSDWTELGIPIVRIQNLNNPSAPFHRTSRSLDAKFKIRTGDLLFAWSGTPGTSFGAHIWNGGDAWLNQHIFKVEFDEDEISKRFLQIAINQNLASYVAQAHGGAGLAHLTKGKFEASEVSLPPKYIQEEIVAAVDRKVSVAEDVALTVETSVDRTRIFRQAIVKVAFEGGFTDGNEFDTTE